MRVTYYAIATTTKASNPTNTLQEVVSAEFGERARFSQLVASHAIDDVVPLIYACTIAPRYRLGEWTWCSAIVVGV